MPEGALINFLAQRENPTANVSLMPPEFIMFGEDQMLASLQKSPPDYIALVHRDTTFYGPHFFGQQYAVRIARWIADNYDIAGGKLYGDLPPFNEENRFSILVVRRKGAGTPGPGLAGASRFTAR